MIETLFTIDTRTIYIQQRTIRVGEELHFQSRNNVAERDGTFTFGKWETTGIVKNYGAVFDPKPFKLRKLVKKFLTLLSR